MKYQQKFTMFETFKGKDKGHYGHHYGSSYMEAFAI
jgi:hypothetical protein